VVQDCMLHIVRNSLDHGLEEPADRMKQNKSEAGTIKVSAIEVEETLQIYIEDDGRGIDGEHVLKKALEKGILSPQQAQNMPLSEKVDLIFAPGFSTKEQATDISGRGLGLDIVRSELLELRGGIRIETAIGKGTKFIVTLPIETPRESNGSEAA
jgi:two-component system chemotaxis sensor kinase CheA